MAEKKLKNEEVKKFLLKTGYIFEMEVAEAMKKLDYSVSVNEYFLDLEQNKKREIDIIAKKTINNIELVFVVECKQSLQDSWVFVQSRKQSSRYYAFIKHLPTAYRLKKNGLFNNLHSLDFTIPLVQNYITLEKHTHRKGNNLPIDECIEKLPKALISTASKHLKGVKTIFIPLALFNGQFFVASYENEAVINEVNLVQYFTDFSPGAYTQEDPSNRLTGILDQEKGLYAFGSNEVTKLKAATSKLHSFYLIDFVTKQGLSDYLKRIEKEVNSISTKKWTYNLEAWKIKKPKLPKTS